MPRYSYHCPDCGHQTELSRTVNARDEEVKCSSCGSSMSRELGSFALHQASASFRPKNLAQQLAGPGVVSPQYGTETSVLRR
ncbi:MAG: zinc ribbon domain-containing protein [Verrucomicrobia bacterium]|nr:MAG: zinc ribbon domain-containing protein [Verrucomicrobiota bacterium]